MSVSSFDQLSYQVRFEWGVEGAAELAEAHIVVLVDGLSASPSAELAAELAAGGGVGAPIVLAANLRNRRAVAARVLKLQAELGDRAVVNVVAAGEPRTEREGDTAVAASARFAIEDLLAAGAVIDALAEQGIDHISPEAAVACAAYTGLGRATKHLVSASGSGRALAAAGRADEIVPLLQLDSDVEAPEFVDGVFRS